MPFCGLAVVEALRPLVGDRGPVPGDLQRDRRSGRPAAPGGGDRRRRGQPRSARIGELNTSLYRALRRRHSGGLQERTASSPVARVKQVFCSFNPVAEESSIMIKGSAQAVLDRWRRSRLIRVGAGFSVARSCSPPSSSRRLTSAMTPEARHASGKAGPRVGLTNLVDASACGARRKERWDGRRDPDE